MAECSIKAQHRAKAGAKTYYGGNVQPPRYTHNVPKNHAYPPDVI